jgi:hypothetical protein
MERKNEIITSVLLILKQKLQTEKKGSIGNRKFNSPFANFAPWLSSSQISASLYRKCGQPYSKGWSYFEDLIRCVTCEDFFRQLEYNTLFFINNSNCLCSYPKSQLEYKYINKYSLSGFKDDNWPVSLI